MTNHAGHFCWACMKPFTGVSFDASLGYDRRGAWVVRRVTCRSCGNYCFSMLSRATDPDKGTGETEWEVCLRPLLQVSPILARGVPKECAKDYREALLVLPFSPNASAALARRCLQAVLRVCAHTESRVLHDQIVEVLESHALPERLAEHLDAVRAVGNIAAHATKSTTTGEIVSVAPKEAEWLLGTLHDLFEFYFVQLPKAKRRKLSLNRKLRSVGKPPLK